ncbi:hypothetical protein LZP73_21285, partial [Shewanella sp. AS16]|uniref:hypothetical protein n=1 Tax=Shewanella sp. AS16 TaxID=2907625 RepID=UPI001F311A68
RFHALKARGKEYNKVVTAVARELTGYLWDIAREFEVDKPITAGQDHERFFAYPLNSIDPRSPL